jgi:hypothetical protein
MDYTLIPLPLSLLFVLVFIVAAELVLWRLRKNGRSYRLISNLALALGIVFAALIFVLVLSLAL